MRVFACVFLAAAAVAITVEPVAAAEQTSRPKGSTLNQMQDATSPYLRVFGVTPPPYGHVDFCNRDPKECREGNLEEMRRAGIGAALVELDRVNRQVNAEIIPMTDQAQYGIEDYWTIPVSGRGDCEDYALLKRQRLMRAGWPASALLMTVVFDERNEGHAVLTARTSQGDFVLDNKVEAVKLWAQTPYHYVMRQSYIDPKVWVSLDPSDAASPAAIAGVQANPN